MTRPLTVYGAYIGGRKRIAVAAKTKKEAWEAMKAKGWNGGYHLWTQYACQTINEPEVKAAMATPGIAVVLPS